MDVDRFLPGVIGAFVGVVGWLLVGLYIQRRQFVRQARNAARAVYFEVDVNRMNVEVARDYGSFTPLSRSSFDRLLPELATVMYFGAVASSAPKRRTLATPTERGKNSNIGASFGESPT